MNVLVWPGGTEIGLEVNKALTYAREVNLYSAGEYTSNHAPYVFKQHDPLPSVFHPSCLQELYKLIDRHKIDFLYPAHDDVIYWLADQKVPGVKIVTSPAETVKVCRFKSKTYELLKNRVRVPKVYTDLPDEFPAFIKPDAGQGSLGAGRLDYSFWYHYACSTGRIHKAIVTEYLPGEEYTIDCFTHRRQGLVYVSPRLRQRTRAGISVAGYGINDDHNEFRYFAEAINNELEFHGAWFFQVKRAKNGELALLEVAPRISGTSCFSRVRGVNLPLLSLYEQDGIIMSYEPIKRVISIDRALVNRYEWIPPPYDTVYVDLDDTLIVKDKVNVELVKFLYQCVNAKKMIVVVTRNHDPEAMLMKHKLRALVDFIYTVRGSASRKSSYMKDKPAIFIDDSFGERQDAEQHGIPAFDSSQLELLIDDRK